MKSGCLASKATLSYFLRRIKKVLGIKVLDCRYDIGDNVQGKKCYTMRYVNVSADICDGPHQLTIPLLYFK